MMFGALIQSHRFIDFFPPSLGHAFNGVADGPYIFSFCEDNHDLDLSIGRHPGNYVIRIGWFFDDDFHLHRYRKTRDPVSCMLHNIRLVQAVRAAPVMQGPGECSRFCRSALLRARHGHVHSPAEIGREVANYADSAAVGARVMAGIFKNGRFGTAARERSMGLWILRN